MHAVTFLSNDITLARWKHKMVLLYEQKKTKREIIKLIRPILEYKNNAYAHIFRALRSAEALGLIKSFTLRARALNWTLPDYVYARKKCE
jgi:hypothetical protein